MHLYIGGHFCKLPQVPGNATVRYKRFHGKKFTKVGSKIVYSCNKGFIRHGTRKIKCQKNGNWSNSPPVCKGNDSLSRSFRFVTLARLER